MVMEEVNTATAVAEATIITEVAVVVIITTIIHLAPAAALISETLAAPAVDTIIPVEVAAVALA